MATRRAGWLRGKANKGHGRRQNVGDGDVVDRVKRRTNNTRVDLELDGLAVRGDIRWSIGVDLGDRERRFNDVDDVGVSETNGAVHVDKFDA